ncbi:MAG: DnaJ domain-containing protein [Azospirillaceae bacterium]
MIPPLEPDAQAKAGLRPCDHPDCVCPGEFRAPKSRDRLREYFWFCLDHVREYNRAWNFYAGMSDLEVEAAIRSDTIWQRSTQPLGSWRQREEAMREKVARAFQDETFQSSRSQWFNEEGRRNREQASRMMTEEQRALAELELSWPIDLAQIKARYKILVKKHHPDANGGDKAAEEKLKAINHAYGVLKAAIRA